MSDVLTSVQRSHCMSRIRGKDTKPELIVRRLIHATGCRFRLHVASLPGKPDIVLASRKKIVLVHGCFWHRHHCRYGQVFPATRADFWANKFAQNRKRDIDNRTKLRKLGWTSLVIWECETRDLKRLKSRLFRFLGDVKR